MADKTALVIGASRGIGLGLVEELAGRGWRVIGTRRSAASDKGLQAFADRSDGRVIVETLDLEERPGIDALAGRLAGETLDLLFVNAGISGPRGKVGAASREAVAQLFVTNTVAPIHVAEAFLDRMREGPGVIALMTSGLGSVSIGMRAGTPLYSASKAALNRLTRDFTGDLGSRKLTVLSVSPGWVRTDMGGSGAPLSVQDSARGVIDLVEAKAGTRDHGYFGHDGKPIAW